MAITEATFLEWLVEDGEAVTEGQDIYSIGTDKVDVDIESPAAGVLRHGVATPDEIYDVGTEIGFIERSA
jgi:pyruvate/2-oxoglutarate dehydrogenase complex dihydrolipoamide acyltransferase (E2) component